MVVPMAWTVETLSDVVDAELEALPADMRVRFSYISRLIEEFSLDRVREPPRQALAGSLVGNAHEGQGRHLTGNLRHGNWSARGRGARLRQEDPEDPKTRD